MDKKTLFLAGAVLLSMTLASCSQETDVAADHPKTVTVSLQDVDNLTSKLKAYDSRFSPRKRPLLDKSDTKKALTWLDWLKVGIADVKGAISGYKEGGWTGAALGAVVSSLEKYAEIYEKRHCKQDEKAMQLDMSVISNSDSQSFRDSIGYYHTLSEEVLYKAYGNEIRAMSPLSLIQKTDAFLRYKSLSYRNTFKLTQPVMSRLKNKALALRNIPDSSSVSFFEYCDKIKAIEPVDSSYIDFAEEYLYTCVCANVDDIKDYTLEVLRQIDSSNADGRSKQILASSILIAYSSLIYSVQVECVDIE